MFDTLDAIGWTPRQAALVAGLAIGVLFGVFAAVSRFCLRRTVSGTPEARRRATAIWLAALSAALLGTQAAIAAGALDLTGHRFLSDELPLVGLIAGGLTFGVGMVLTRGCISRLTVLGASGNLRALTVLLVFAVVAHATLKGVLAPVRTTLASETFRVPTLDGGGLIIGAMLLIVAVWTARSAGASRTAFASASLLGLLVPLGWWMTGTVLQDDFDPIAVESLSFTLPQAETLFWLVASTAIGPGFGVGLIGGVLLGALALQLLRGEFRWQSFSSPRETGRYVAGGIAMGIGGVLAGGCTVGAGLSGVATLGTGAIVALCSIVVGGRVAATVLDERGSDPIARPSDTTTLVEPVYSNSIAR